MASDPFHHHPELRDKITDPEASFFRKLDVEALSEKVTSMGLSTDWWFSEEDREALRRAALRGHTGGDLWVFAYGSLMWDPALDFVELRRARVSNYARAMIIKDIHGGRGTVERPGLIAALDRGNGCDGLAFRIAADDIEAETRILWLREQLGPAYRAAFVSAELTDGPVAALTFVADHETELIDASMSREEQIRFAATGAGVFGTSLEYLAGIAEHFEALGIEDADLFDLLASARDWKDDGAP